MLGEHLEALPAVRAADGAQQGHDEDVHQAIALAASEGTIDALVTDIVMPGMTGPELGRELCAARPDLPVLYVSGYVGDALKRHGLADGTAILQKPFSPDELLARLVAFLGERTAADDRRATDGG